MIDIRIGDCRHLIHDLDDEYIDCVMTSPPYWGLRDYKTEPIIFDGLPYCEHEWNDSVEKDPMYRGGSGQHERGYFMTVDSSGNHQSGFCSKCGAWRGQLGLEPTPELFIKHLLDFFDDVKLKLKAEGNVFVNLGDTYASSTSHSDWSGAENWKWGNKGDDKFCRPRNNNGVKNKSLLMIPERFAWGMIERGWILRNSIIWYKPNHMPESVTDRMTKAHEVIYHFVKQQRYYYNLDAIRRQHISTGGHTPTRKITKAISFGKTSCFNGNGATTYHENGANPGDVWEITTQPYSEAHFATFPLELVRRPILAGCPVGGTVLDPFGGSGTVGEFCRHNDRNAILFELNPEYKKLIEDRCMSKIHELETFL